MKMKKILAVVLAAVMLLGVVALTGCTSTADTLKFGMGVAANYSDITDATEEANGSGTVNTTAVAVLLDADGKIVKIDLDTAQYKAAWTTEGKIVATEDFRTKYDKGADYGMAVAAIDKNGDGKSLEWNEQADAFMATATGKTLDEVKALMADDGYGTGDLATAGCTIHVTDFITALEKAVANAVDSEATAEDTLQVAMVGGASYSNADASEEADGIDELDTTVVAAVVNAEGKVVVAKTDSTQGKFSFDMNGASTLGDVTEIKSKLELGDDYAMAPAAIDKDGNGVTLEWYDQAAAFDTALVGKTADEIAGLNVDGYGSEELLTAGCSMSVADMVAAAVAAATVA